MKGEGDMSGGDVPVATRGGAGLHSVRQGRTPRYLMRVSCCRITQLDWDRSLYTL